MIDSIPKGGYLAPNSTVGDNALWKNDQNIAKKNNASETVSNKAKLKVLIDSESIKFIVL